MTNHLYFKNIFQISQWLPEYKWSFFRLDLIAGITLASFVLPESMAYASLAGLPSEVGIYCCIAGGLLFALFTTGRQIAVGPTSAISLMVGASVAVLSGGDLGKAIAIASLTAFAIFVISLLAYLFKLSSLMSFISENILLGFKAGAALSIISTQLPKLFSLHAEGPNFFSRIYHLIIQIPESNLTVLIFGITAFLLLRLGHHFFPGRPVSLLVVIGALALFTIYPLVEHGFHMAGEIPSGLPEIKRPSLRFSDIDGIFGLALGCFLMGYVETVSVARTFGEKNNYQIDPQQELLSLGMANLGTSITGAYPVAGGLSQSTVNDKAGAKTPMSLIICSVVLILILMFLTDLLKNLPEVLLAAVVLDAVLGLIKIKSLKEIYSIQKSEFWIAMVAVFSVLIFGILKGVLISVVFSILKLIKKSKNPNISVLGLIPGTEVYSDIERNPTNSEITGIRILRVESSILYFNADFVEDRILELCSDPAILTVILDLNSSPHVDVTGAKMLFKISEKLREEKKELKIVGARAEVRDILRKLHLEEQIGKISRRDTIQDIVSKVQGGRP
ncbi:SulP family inorganic anion transporter [Shivajiella indica]|uniref:SulP family inorganic anion transporter n=1 Tax=Shivajiella indica TaxID=872115 RepID=A0ABW5B6R7_9BACT